MEPNTEKQALPDYNSAPYPNAPPPAYPGGYQSPQAAAAPIYQPPGMTHPGGYQSPQAAAAPIYQPPGMTYPEKTPGMAPGMPYPANPAYPATTAYAPGQNTVIVTQPGTVVLTQQQARPPATAAIVFSCCVFCCCCWPLGLAAFVFAVMSTSSTDYNSAMKNLKVSKYLSIAGLIIGCIIAPLFIWYEVEKSKPSSAYSDYDY